MLEPRAADIELVEVGPRDGLQNEPRVLDVGTRAELVRRLLDAGVRRMETVSFVHPDRVPQMAGAEELFDALPRDAGATFIGLVVNARGFERARAAGVEEINYVAVASDSFGQHNQGATIAQTLETWRDLARSARAAGMRCAVTLSVAWGCPFEGEVPLARFSEIVAALLEENPLELGLADTIGVAAPSEVQERIEAARSLAAEVPLRCHFHNTRNTGLANVFAAHQAGVRSFDASCGGIGGCPFAPAATGNVPTEDVLYMFERMGIRTGIEIARIVETARWLGDRLGHEVPGGVTRAGLFPPAARARQEA
jgi:hydroxymethylglutaryl-CoA lyase